MLGLIGAGLAIGGSRGLASSIFGMAKAGRGLAKAKAPRLYKFGTRVAGGAVAYKGYSEYEDFKHQKRMSMYGDSEINEAVNASYERRHRNNKILGAGAIGGVIAATYGGPAYVNVLKGIGKASVSWKWGSVGKKAPGAIGKMLHPGFDRSGLTYGAAAGAGASLGAGLAGPGPRGRIAGEGQIEGIQSSRGGGISPELQFSTQGLTLGIHSKRKRRVV